MFRQFTVKFADTNFLNGRSATNVRELLGAGQSKGKYTEGKEYMVYSDHHDAGEHKFLLVNDFGIFEWINTHYLMLAKDLTVISLDGAATMPEIIPGPSVAVKKGKKALEPVQPEE